MKMNQEQLADLIHTHSAWRPVNGGSECKGCGYIFYTVSFNERHDWFKAMSNHVAYVIKAYEDKP